MENAHMWCALVLTWPVQIIPKITKIIVIIKKKEEEKTEGVDKSPPRPFGGDLVTPLDHFRGSS